MCREDSQLDKARAALEEEFLFCCQTVTKPACLNGELINRKFDKGKGIQRLCAHLGVDIRDTFGFGDSMNDLEMMQTAGLSICMGNGSETLKKAAHEVCGRVEEAGHTPMVYFNKNLGYLTYDLSQLTQYGFWLAEYDSVPDFYYHFDLWQYTNEGAVAGIQGNVDLNLELRAVQKETEE